MKIDIRVCFAEGCQDFRKQVRGRDSRSCEVDHVFFHTGEIFQKIIADLQHTDSTVIKLISSGRDRCFFRSAQDQPGMQFFLKGTHMCTDCRLCEIKLAGCFRKASVINNGNKSFQLLKFHDVIS